MRQLVQCFHIFAYPLWSSVLRDVIACHARSLVMWVKQCEPQAGQRNGMQAVFLLGQATFGGQFVAGLGDS